MRDTEFEQLGRALNDEPTPGSGRKPFTQDERAAERSMAYEHAVLLIECCLVCVDTEERWYDSRFITQDLQEQKEAVMQAQQYLIRRGLLVHAEHEPAWIGVLEESEAEA